MVHTACCSTVHKGPASTDRVDERKDYVAQGSMSAFGAFLDPVADKLMVATALVLLCTQPIASGPWQGNAWLIPVVTSGGHLCCYVHLVRLGELFSALAAAQYCIEWPAAAVADHDVVHSVDCSNPCQVKSLFRTHVGRQAGTSTLR